MSSPVYRPLTRHTHRGLPHPRIAQGCPACELGVVGGLSLQRASCLLPNLLAGPASSGWASSARWKFCSWQISLERQRCGVSRSVSDRPDSPRKRLGPASHQDHWLLGDLALSQTYELPSVSSCPQGLNPPSGLKIFDDWNQGQAWCPSFLASCPRWQLYCKEPPENLRTENEWTFWNPFP